MSIKDLIASHENTPVQESINEITCELAKCEVLLPTEGVSKPGQPLKIKIGSDNRGLQWAYIYTDESEIKSAFPDGTSFVGLQFSDAFHIISSNPNFAGISINPTNQHRYFIPRELFDQVQAQLDTQFLKKKPNK